MTQSAMIPDERTRPEPAEDVVDLRQYLSAIVRQWRVLTATMLVSLLLGALYLGGLFAHLIVFRDAAGFGAVLAVVAVVNRKSVV